MINGIDISDPTQNFTSQEWEALGPANRTLVMEMRNRNASSGGRGRGRGRGRGEGTRNASATASSVTFDGDTHEQGSAQSDNARSERGGRNGRGFGRGAYGQNNS